MKLIGLCGAAGAGKDTAARLLPFRSIAFADQLYLEVSRAFDVPIAWMKRREVKDSPQSIMALQWGPLDFAAFNPEVDIRYPQTPRKILQRWADWRRADDPEYFVRKTEETIKWYSHVTVTDVRFANEVALIRRYGGQIWQIVRPGVTAGGTGHVSDTDGSQFSPDIIIDNSGNLSELREKVLAAYGR